MKLKISDIHYKFTLIMCYFIGGFSTSCLKETPLPAVVDIGYKLTGDYQTTPLTITLENNTTGANFKEQKSTGQQIAVKPNSGLYTLRDLHFGISQARNTVGVSSRPICNEC